MKKFDIPGHYRSPVISSIKEERKSTDPRKNDYTPTLLDFGSVKFLIARHFGFCFGVENAIDIAYKTIEENKGKNVFLLSEMIHNPSVNEDLLAQGIRFVMDNYGRQFIPWEEIKEGDIVIIPAFGTTVEIERLLKEKGVDTVKYNTTCPFVERVWNKAEQLGAKNFTVIIHGKSRHEETRATFSHSAGNAPSIIVKDLEETRFLCGYIEGKKSLEEFEKFFAGKTSQGFSPEKDLSRIGVVNQTTMLASETEAISNLLRDSLLNKFGAENIKEHFADTRDTLCYATNDNQQAVYGLLDSDADLALVIGGYNSSNTSHLVELLERKFKTYFISSAEKIISPEEILHFDTHLKQEIKTNHFLDFGKDVTIAVTSGASCPDSLVEAVLRRVHSFFPGAKPFVNEA